jgi:hypothetical protein
MQHVQRIVYEEEDMKETGRVKIQILPSERIVYEKGEKGGVNGKYKFVRKE